MREADDAGPLLHEFALDADRETEGTRWSYCRDNGGVRLIVLDSRAGRVLDPGKRTMVDDEEWEWFVEHVKGDFDHLLIASSLPFLLPGGEHGLEAWNEAVAEGAWGKRGEPDRREGPPRARPRALGRVPALVRAHVGAPRGGRLRASTASRPRRS